MFSDHHYRLNRSVARLLLMLLSVLGIACSSAGQEDANGKFRVMEVREAREFITANGNNGNFVLLDTRTRAEYDKSHLEGAVFMDYSAEDFWQQVEMLDRTKIYLVYCHSGSRSGKTVKYMKENGFEESHNMAGGIIAWKKAGYGVVRP